jgi:hypothetical protein
LPAPLAPGAATTLTIAIDPPAAPGPYLLQLDLVQKMVAWFEAQRAAPLKVPVEVKGADTRVETAKEAAAISSTGGSASSRFVIGSSATSGCPSGRES